MTRQRTKGPGHHDRALRSFPPLRVIQQLAGACSAGAIYVSTATHPRLHEHYSFIAGGLVQLPNGERMKVYRISGTRSDTGDAG